MSYVRRQGRTLCGFRMHLGSIKSFSLRIISMASGDLDKCSWPVLNCPMPCSALMFKKSRQGAS